MGRTAHGRAGALRAALACAVALAAFAATAQPAGAVTLGAARSAVLKVTKAERSAKGVILFSLRAPIRARSVIRETGRRPAKPGSSRRTMPLVLRAGAERAYFFYLDRGAQRLYEHPGRVILVDARTGDTIRSRTLRYAPAINGRLPLFLRNRLGYENARYRVTSSAYAVAGSARAAAVNPLGSFGASPIATLRSAASQGAAARALVAEHSCTVSVGGAPARRAAIELASRAPVLPRLFFQPAGVSLAAFVRDAIDKRGCRDILITASGDGRPSSSSPAIRTFLSTAGSKMREYQLTPAALAAIAAANPSVTFKLLLDGPGSGAFIAPLRSLANILLIATSSTASQTAYRYLPRKRIAGKITNNPLRRTADSSFFTTLFAGSQAFADSDAEVAHALTEVAAGRAPSFLAYLIARGFALSRPFDFTADLGATQQLYVRGFTPTAPGGAPVNRAPTATPRAVTTAEDSPREVAIAGSDPDGDALTFAVASLPAHGTLSGTAPNLTYTPAPGYNGPDAFTFTVSDGALVSAAATVAITVTAVDDPPVTSASGTLAYTENDPATAIAPALTVTDSDSGVLTGASVQITSGLHAAEDALTLPARPDITGSFDAASGTLTLTGSATVAAYEAALRDVRYRNLSDDPSADDRTVTFRARDAGGFGPAGTRTITVAPVNDPPAITTSAGPLGYTENDPPAAVDAGLVLTDPDSPITGASVRITGNHASPEDVLALPAQPTISGSYDSATGTLTLSGTDTAAAYEAALRAVTYANTSNNPSLAQRTVTFLASDASSTSAPATRDIAVGALDNAPDIANSAGALAYTENDPATAIDTAITITDPDSANLTGATVRISGNYALGEDVLALPAQPNVTAAPFDTATGTLTLSGTATIAQYEAALEAVTYRNTSDDPATATRTVTYQARDAGGFGAADTHAVTVAAVDDPPVAVDDAATVAEDSGASAVAVLPNDTDVDGGPRSIASVTQPANGAVVITGGGTGVTYAPSANYCNSPPATTLDTFTYTLTPGGSAATVTMTVTCVDDPPVAVNDAATVGEDSGASAVAVLGNDTDIDGGPKSVVSVTQPANGAVVITGGGTAVSYAPNANYCNSPPGTTPDTFTYTLNGGSSATVSVTVTCVDDPPVAVADSATVAEDSGASAVGVLANDTDVEGGPKSVASVTQPANGAVVITGGGTGVTYAPNANSCNTGGGGLPDTFTYTLNGGSTATVSMTVTCADDAPDVTTSGGALAYAENDPATPIDPGVTVADPDVGGLIASATVQITANYAGAQDVLALSNALSHPLITPMFAGDTLTLSGNASPAEYQSALRDVTYGNTSDAPSTLTRTVTFTVTDTTALSDAGTRDIQVTSGDDSPVAVNDAATVAEDSGASAVPVLANDTDADGGPSSIASVTQPANGAVVITGGGSGLTYTPNANYCNSPPATTLDTFTYTLTPGGATATVSMTVTCVADPPVVDTTAAALAYTENDPPTPIDPGVTVTDADAGAAIASATVSITANYVAAQDVLALANAASHLPITAMVAGNTLTLSGSASPAAYQAALRDVTYANGSEAPSTATRTVTFSVTDDSALTGSDTRAISVASVDDNPAAVADAFTVLEDSGATAQAVLTNDTDVDGGPKSITSVTQPANGTVVITGGGTGLTYAPNANYCNDPPATTLNTFTYTLTPGGSTATVSMTVTCVNDAPTAGDDTFTAASSAVGNTALVVNAPGDGPQTVAGPKKSLNANILANDSDPDGPNPVAVVAGTFGSNDGGTVVIESDGDFTFTPAAGTSCTDTSDFFDYTVTDGNTPTAGTDVGRVNVTITGCVWYVNNNAAGNAGTSTAPFDTLAQAQTASGAGQTIFVEKGSGTTGVDAGIDLKANQRLLGEAATLQIGSDVLQTGIPANRPTITDSGADVVKLASGDTVRGVEIDPQGTGGGIAGGDGTAGGSITGGTIDDVRIVDAGTAGTQPGLELDTTAGTFDVSDLTVSNGGSATAIGVRLNNAGTVNLLSAGTISITTAGAKALDANGTSLGAGSVFDDVTVTGSGSGGVSMVNTTGTTTFSNLALTTTSGAPAAFLLTNAGSVTVATGGTANVSATGGPAVDVTGTAGASLAFDDVDSAGSASTGVHLTGLGAGTFSASSSSSLTNASGIDFDLDGGSGAVTYDGTITDDVGQLVRVQNTTNGTKDFNGAITDGDDGDGSGIALTSNTGATIRFDGGVTLSTGANAAFAATGGGTLAVTDPAGAANNSITTTTGTALNVSGTTISSDDVTLERVSANGAANAILLSNTGSSGNLVVTGNGGTCTNANTSGCSGGQIANATGADNSGTTPSGTGIVLNNTLSPSFTRMWIHDASNYAIRGTSVAGFTLANSVINGSNGNNGTTPFDDSSVWFDNLTGSASVTNSHVSGGFEDNFRVVNTSGSLNRITFTSDTIGDNSAAGGNDGVSLESATTAGQLQATVQSSTFTGAGGDLLQYDHNGSGTGDLVLTGNGFSNNHPGIATGGGGLTLTNGGTSGATTMSITGANTFRDAVGNALTIAKSTGTSTQSGTFSGNTIGVNAVANSGSAEGDGLKLQTLGQGTDTWTVTNNTIRGYNNFGVELLAGGSATAQGGSVNATITGNTIDQPGNTAGTLGLPKNGVHLNIGTVPGDTYAACAVIGGPGALANSLASAGADAVPPAGGGQDVRLRQRQSTTIRLPGYAGAATDTTAVQNFVAANNPSGGPSVIASVNSPPGGGFTGTGSSCP
jgi:hypothetical protein